MNAAELLLGATAIQSYGERPALICEDESVSYAELARRARASAAALRALGVRAGDRVALLMRDTPECAAAWLGALYAGAAVVSLNPRALETDCRHIVADSAARLVLVDDALAGAQPGLVAELARTGRLVGTAAWRDAARDAKEAAPADVDEDAEAFLLYSSGTTGRPKGMAYAHGALRAVGEAMRAFGIRPGERVFTTSKLFFAYGLEHALLAPLRLGMTSLLCADWPETEPVLRIVERHRPDAVFSVPTIYRRLLADAGDRVGAFRGARRFVAAGERLSPQLVSQWREATGGELLNLYGMSETFCACMVTPPGTSNGERTGAPLPIAEVRLTEDGVLWVRHPAMTRGYLNLPEQSREQFKDGWFCSRDMFVRDSSGYFIHQGRADELLKVAGQWVIPAELEEAAARDPAVGEAACVPVLDGDGLQRLALFVTGAAGADRAAAAAIERTLPPHKRPKWVRVVTELPRTATGKVQRFKLREILERELSGKP